MPRASTLLRRALAVLAPAGRAPAGAPGAGPAPEVAAGGDARGGVVVRGAALGPPEHPLDTGDHGRLPLGPDGPLAVHGTGDGDCAGAGGPEGVFRVPEAGE